MPLTRVLDDIEGGDDFSISLLRDAANAVVDLRISATVTFLEAGVARYREEVRLTGADFTPTERTQLRTVLATVRTKMRIKAGVS